MSDIGFLSEDEYLEKDYFLESKLEIKTPEEEAKTDKKMKVIKIIFLIMCIILAIEICIIKFVKPSLSLPKITVSGISNYTAEEVADELSIMGSSNWFDFDVEEAVGILSAEPGIEGVVVEKEFPNKIFVNITERTPVAITFFVQNNNTIPVQIDRNGVLFYDETKEFLNSDSLPIVSGIPINYLANGMRIPQMYLPLMEQIAKISANHKDYFAGISEICVIPTDNDNYELALISAQNKVRVIADRTLNEDVLKDMMVVLDIIKRIELDVPEVDLRYQSVSIKTK